MPKGWDFPDFFNDESLSSWCKKIRTAKSCIICKAATFLNSFDGILNDLPKTVQTFWINILGFYLRDRGRIKFFSENNLILFVLVYIYKRYDFVPQKMTSPLIYQQAFHEAHDR